MISYPNLLRALPLTILTTVALSACAGPGESSGGLLPEDRPSTAIPIDEGVVKKVDQKPNVSEDGVFRIEVITRDKSVILIRADEFLNTPILPEEEGKECLTIDASVKSGDLVKFSLPPADKAYTAAVDPEGKFAAVVTTCGDVGDELMFTVAEDAKK